MDRGMEPVAVVAIVDAGATTGTDIMMNICNYPVSMSERDHKASQIGD